MKNILNLFTVLFAFIAITFTIQSCSEDGDWENGSNGGQFGFTIERDNYFIEKAVGETNQIKFNIKPNYNFETIKTTFKYTTNLNGVVKLNNQVLNQNQEYTFTNKENIFEYTGNAPGDHLFKISVKNEKGATKEEEFSLKYGISEFTHTFTGGTADIYQGDITPYVMKITPNAGQPTAGYEIKFNSYNGDIKLNGVTAQTGQFYPLPNIDSFTVSLNTNQVGQGALDYTIKNATVSRNYNIQQTIIARKIVIESMNVNATNVLPNSQLSLIGIIKKTPVTTANSSIKYKTWISSSSNNNTNGIQTTNNVYIPFSLTGNGSFNINFNAIEKGNYTYNVQVQDEYGNESEVKSFNIIVAPDLEFVGALAMKLDTRYTIPGLPAWYKTYFKNFNRSFKVVAGGNTTVTKIDYNISFTHAGQNFNYNFSENVTNGTNTFEVANQDFNISQIELGYFAANSLGANFLTNIQATIKAYSSNGATLTKSVTPTYTWTEGLF